MSIDAAIAALTEKGIDIDVNAASVKAKSRDFFWYSPVLKDRLDHVVADFVATPKSEAEVVEVLRVCYAYDVPVTTRGTGTGNQWVNLLGDEPITQVSNGPLGAINLTTLPNGGYEVRLSVLDTAGQTTGQCLINVDVSNE